MEKSGDEKQSAGSETVRRVAAGSVAVAATVWTVCLLRGPDGPAAGVPSDRETIAALLLSLALVTGFRSLDGPFASGSGRRTRRVSHASAAASLWLACFAAIWVTLFASALLKGYLQARSVGEAASVRVTTDRSAAVAIDRGKSR